MGIEDIIKKSKVLVLGYNISEEDYSEMDDIKKHYQQLDIIDYAKEFDKDYYDIDLQFAKYDVIIHRANARSSRSRFIIEKLNELKADEKEFADTARPHHTYWLALTDTGKQAEAYRKASKTDKVYSSRVHNASINILANFGIIEKMKKYTKYNPKIGEESCELKGESGCKQTTIAKAYRCSRLSLENNNLPECSFALPQNNQPI